ncbi:Hypothetical protein FKW44_021316 [Caligus rogercresseyi]|uniref:Uncharacterized protein n=1 Tax=Caligus rogercresseyi TaxID=217165 RepID=A0A7T8GR23_CALRO|nr:Hypothetical protein FKW44_021316 [Caligus rogercresseyi]
MIFGQSIVLSTPSSDICVRTDRSCNWARPRGSCWTSPLPVQPKLGESSPPYPIQRRWRGRTAGICIQTRN